MPVPGLIPLLWLTWLTFGSIPPLASEQAATLASARDGVDGLDEAFATLVEHVATWPEEAQPGSEPVRLEPDLEAMALDPSGYRGDLCQIEGRLEQHRTLPPPHQNMQEWFIRASDDDVAIVFVLDPAEGGAVHDGRRYHLRGRFYKVIDATARDGQRRSYPAFVGRIVPASSGRDAAPELLLVIAAPVLVLGAIFLLIRAWARRRSRNPIMHRDINARRERDGRVVAALDDRADLPDDPAAALAELRRRSVP